jgi:hypothetical protein
MSGLYSRDGAYNVCNSQLNNVGNLTALNSQVVLDVEGQGVCVIDIRGTFVGTITFQSSVDNINWVTTNAIPLGSAGNASATSTVTTTGAWLMPASGSTRIKAIMTLYTSGSATVVMRADPDASFNYSALIGTPAVALAASTHTIGDIGLHYRPSASGAATVSTVMSPATVTVTAVKASAGRLVGLYLHNSSATIRSIKFWNSLTAGVTLGSTAAVFEVDINPNSSVQLTYEAGLGFSVGITYAITAAKGLTDNTGTGLVANEVSGFLAFS